MVPPVARSRGQPSWKISKMNLPTHIQFTALELSDAFMNQAPGMLLKPHRELQCVGVFQGEFQRVKSAIETLDVHRCLDITETTDGRHHIPASPQPHVPNNEFARAPANPLRQCQLPDVKHLGLCDGTFDGMKRFAVHSRTDAVSAIGKSNQFVGGTHGQTNPEMCLPLQPESLVPQSFAPNARADADWLSASAATSDLPSKP